VQPSWSGWRIGDERRFARADEAGRRISSPAGWWGTPDYVRVDEKHVMYLVRVDANRRAARIAFFNRSTRRLVP
jgi:hypothetical protein